MPVEQYLLNRVGEHEVGRVAYKLRIGGPCQVLVGCSHIEIGACKVASVFRRGFPTDISIAGGVGLGDAERTIVELISVFHMAGRVVALLAIGALVGGIEVVEVLVGFVDCSSPPTLRQAVLYIERAAGVAEFVRIVAYTVGVHIPHGASRFAIGEGQGLPGAIGFEVTGYPFRRVVGAMVLVDTIFVSGAATNDEAKRRFQDGVLCALDGIVVADRYLVRQQRDG